MQLSPQIVFRNMKRSDWIENLVHERLKKLDSFCNSVIGCRVVIEMPHRHHHQGNHYLVRIDITVPDKEIVVSREASEHALGGERRSWFY